jgi:hypothetical protein
MDLNGERRALPEMLQDIQRGITGAVVTRY